MNFGIKWQPASDAAIILRLTDDGNFHKITFVKYLTKKFSLLTFSTARKFSLGDTKQANEDANNFVHAREDSGTKFKNSVARKKRYGLSNGQLDKS